jgi:predicted nucleic acid-binding protein
VRIVVDANILVSELLRERGQALIASPALELYIAEKAWSETQHEIHRRVAIIEQQGRIAPGTGNALAVAAIAAITAHVRQVPAAAYAPLEATARLRVPRDPDDWPTVAAALVLDAGIWTRDGDFLGCGVPTWTTETLIAFLQPPATDES